MAVWRIRSFVCGQHLVSVLVELSRSLCLFVLFFWALSDFTFFRNHKFWVANWQILTLPFFFAAQTKPISIEFGTKEAQSLITTQQEKSVFPLFFFVFFVASSFHLETL
jgi:hypothetical protein